MTADYWVEISQGGTQLGAGFLLTRCYALTALHCLDGMEPGDDRLDIALGTGQKVSGRVHRRSPEADLALIDIPHSGGSPVAVPHADRAAPGETWRSPYRPSNRHAYLSGRVSAFPVEYQCEGGAIEAMQLGCAQPLGDYSGYSGSPVERDAGHDGQAVLGLLLEQYPDQREPGRYAPVLFAATIAEVFRRFDCFAVDNLLDLLLPSPGPAPRQHRRPDPTGPAIKAAGSALEALRDWQASGLIDELDVGTLKMQVIMRGLASAGFEDDA